MKQITATQSYGKKIKELQSLRLRMIYRLKNGKYGAIPYPHHSDLTGAWLENGFASVSWEQVAGLEEEIKNLQGKGFVMYKK